jgi:hypothetical protein
MGLHEAPDIETDLRFGLSYASLGLLVKVALALLGSFWVWDTVDSNDVVAEVMGFELSTLVLCLHAFGVIASVYVAKRATGISVLDVTSHVFRQVLKTSHFKSCVLFNLMMNQCLNQGPVM